jgi:hypothetical protein
MFRVKKMFRYVSNDAKINKEIKKKKKLKADFYPLTAKISPTIG